MRTYKLIALLGFGLIPSLLFAQYYKIDIDLQDPGKDWVLDRVFTGNTIGLEAKFYDGTTPYVVTNWTMFFRYGRGQYDTNGMVPVRGVASINRVVFESVTNLFFSPSENYYFSISGVDGVGRKRTFARGRMIEEYDPSTAGSGGVLSNGFYYIGWGNIFGNVEDNQALVDYISSGVTVTNASDAQARATGALALATSIWSSNTAAAASSTGTAAYALAATKVATNDGRYLAALTNAAAFATAVQGAKADSAIQTNHTGNVSVLGRFGLGTNAVTAYPPTRTNAANLLHLVDGGIYLEDKPHLLGGGSATSQTAAIFLGYDAREFGRPALWLNSYDYESGGNTYDAASDIYFGKGASFTDASLRWGLSSRPTNQGWGHESDGQFLIYEFPGLGSSGVGGTRFSILPDSGGIGGPIKLGTETRYPPPSPDPAATLVVNDWTKSPVIVIEGNTNAGAASFPRIRFHGGTNVADIVWSNGVICFTGTASFPMIAIGTNASISNWPSGGGDVSTWWQYAADGDVDIQGNSLLNVANLVGTNNVIYTATVAKAASALQSVPWGEATTNNMTNINWGALGGSVGLTNNQTGVSLGGTFTGEHVGNGASLTNLADATARASITAMGDGIHPRILATVTNGTATLWASSSAWWRVNCDTNALTNWVIDTTGVSAGDTVAMAVEIYRPNANTWAWMPGVTNSSPATNATTLNCFVLISGATNWLVNP